MENVRSVKPALPARLLHGGDYNPDQWLDCPEVLEEAFSSALSGTAVGK